MPAFRTLLDVFLYDREETSQMREDEIRRGDDRQPTAKEQARFNRTIISFAKAMRDAGLYPPEDKTNQ
jgi:hypothetical protein